MNILFIEKENIEIGSYRMFFYNLANWLKSLGKNVVINDENIDKYDVVVFGKSVKSSQMQQVKKQYENKLIGIIQPSDFTSETRSKMKLANFFIVGSIQEKDYYLQYCSYVFHMPLVEDIFTKFKQHEKKEKVCLVYQGNMEHLEQFSPILTKAIEILSQKYPIKLKVVSDFDNLGKWKIGKPKNIEIKYVQWKLDTIEDEILEGDVALVPAIYPISRISKKLMLFLHKVFDRRKGSNRNDYLLRFKNNTNAGRSFLFHQLGIPVVADISPNHFHILSTRNCGFLAYSLEGWITALESLIQSYQYRQTVANNAKQEFDRLYNHQDIANDFLDFLDKISDEKK